MFKLLRWTVIFFLLMITSAAYGMRCQTQLVYEGDTRYDVVRKCGEPLDKIIHEESIPLYDDWGYQIGVTQKVVEVWIYQRSTTDFRYDVYFDDGLVKEIKANRP